MAPVLNWQYGGSMERPAGYAYVAKSYTNALREIGVDLDTFAETVIFHTIPYFDYFSWHPQQRAGIYTMWEHTGVPPAIAEGLKNFDFAFVPCEFSRRLFAPYVDPIYVVPHGIDTDVYYPEPDPKEDSVFRVLAPATGERKGAREVVEGFRLANLPDSELILKGKSAMKFKDTLPTNCRVVDDLSMAGMRRLYWSADVCVSGSRGEGWDLISWEALACGTPVIVPNHTGYRQWNHLAQVRLEEWTVRPSEVTVYGPAGDWHVMRPEEIAGALRYAYDNMETMRRKALRSARKIAATWKWTDAAKTMLLVLGECKPLLEASEGKVEARPMVRVAGVKDLPRYDIGPFAGGPIKTGAEYSLPAEVARVLVDAGYLAYKEA